jgi:hypothetical protein
LGYIEDIVDDLECETESLPELCDSGKSPGVCVGAHRAQPDRAFQHGCGFVLMDKSQLIAFDSLAFRFEIGHLTSDQSLAPGRDRNLTQQN